MSISPVSIAVPQPSTQRGQATHISYDPKHERLAYVNGKSIIVRPVDFRSTSPTIVFSKHIFPTTAVKFSPSGFYIASGDESGQIKIWDVSPKQEPTFEQPIIKSEFQVMSGPIRSIAWDADNSRIIAVGQGKEKFGHAFSWDSGNSIGDIQGHSSPINAVDIKPQRPYRAATVGDDHALVFFNGPPFKFDKSLRGKHTNVVRDVKFSPDGEYIVSVGSDRVINLYEGKTGEFVKKIDKAHEGGIFAVGWLPDSKSFITASADNTLKKWNVESGESDQVYEVSKTTSVANHQIGLALTKDYVVSLSSSGNLNYFTYSGELEQVVKGHQSPITKVEHNKGYVLSGGSDGKLFKWKVAKEGLEAMPELQDDDEHTNYIVDILTVGDVTYTIGWDDTLKLWKDSKVTKSVKLPSQPKQLSKIASGVLVLFESELQLYSDSLDLIGEEKFKFTATCIAPVDADGLKVLATNTTANTIEEFEISGGKITKSAKEFPKMRSPPTLIRVSPDGEYFAVADSAGKYTLFKSSDGSVVSTRWAFHTSKVYDAKWTPDSKYLISGGLDSGLFLYSVERPSKVIKFPLAHASGVSGVDWVEFDADKKSGTFVTAGLDATIRTWDVSI
ncbi:Actin-interacting protein 1 [Candida viswanathii]|uniref:Actin-interacting protein 1 n=1 Tax=Candida viswanathii TaxID=5486 RepID=A0A367Y978_9ASCO|nr:Actin-interacting protein 1 [Candida viswanathii]